MLFPRTHLAALSFAALASAGLIPERRAASSCSVKGYDKTSTYSYDGSGKYATYAACSAKCEADSKCVSFAYGGSECDLYKVSVASNVTPDSGSKYTFYDVSCVASSSTTTSTSSTTTSGMTTSAAASPSCGVKGYDKKTAYYYDGNAADANFAVCSAKCKADSKCVSFAFGSDQCLLYSYNV